MFEVVPHITHQLHRLGEVGVLDPNLVSRVNRALDYDAKHESWGLHVFKFGGPSRKEYQECFNWLDDSEYEKDIKAIREAISDELEECCVDW